MFDFPQPGVGNSGALCEVVRSLRPKTAPFFADPWQQICGNDIVSCWVITHNSGCHILQSAGEKWKGEKKELHWSTEGKWPEKCLQPEVLCWKNSLLQDSVAGTTVQSTEWGDMEWQLPSKDSWVLAWFSLEKCGFLYFYNCCFHLHISSKSGCLTKALTLNDQSPLCPYSCIVSA